MANSKSRVQAEPALKPVVSMAPVAAPAGSVTIRYSAPANGKPDESAFNAAQVQQAVETVGNAVLSGLKAIRPSKATVEFGLKFSGSSGHLVSWMVDVNTEAHVIVTVEWEKEGPAEAEHKPATRATAAQTGTNISDIIHQNIKADTENQIFSQLEALGSASLAVETSTETRRNAACPKGTETRKAYRVNLGNGMHSESWHSPWTC